ncbi:MAG: hypothetical protein OXN79_01910, partial [bacterium]|nr:hypothetical protein [bacterium]
YQTGQLPEFHDIVNTLIERSDEILNWHHTGRPSNGRIEAPTTASKSCGEQPTASPTPTTPKPAAC